MINFVDEWKSISDDTVAIASDIANEIIKDSEKCEKQVSSEHNILFKEGDFPYQVNGVLGKINELQVNYTIYYCENETMYQVLYNAGALICDADYYEECIDISTAYVNGVLKEDLIDDIHHEINHLLQYGNNFTKSDRTNNLYDTAVNIAQNTQYSMSYRVPSLLIYYTFRHEVDSFAAQFYSYIKRTYNKASQIDNQDGFSKCLNGFQPYKNLHNSILIYNDNSKSNDTINGIKALRINPDTFEFRIDKGVTRFMRKMRHVYQRCCMELRRGKTNEWIFKRIPMLYEKYGTVNESFERAYTI